MLYVTFDLDGAELDLPVLVKRGAAGTTKLAENVSALPPERYRVAKYLIANPADVDGDCIDDISELADPLGMNPVNPAPAIHSTDGAVTIPDLATIASLSAHHGDGRSRLKLILLGWDTDTPGVYFTNTGTHPSHRSFLDAVGLERRDVIDGAMIYDPQRVASNGRPGYYYFWLEAGSPSFSLESRVYALLAAAMPLLEGNFAFHIPDFMLPAYQRELPLYEASRLKLLFEDDLHTEVSFLALNQGEGYGLLRHMDLEDRARSSRRGDLPGTAQRSAPRRGGHHDRAADAAVARQHARRAERQPQCLHPRRASRIPTSRPSWAATCVTR